MLDHAAKATDATLLLRRRRPIGEPAGLAPTGWPFAATVEGTAGAGRVCLALAELGTPVASLVQAVLDPDVSAPSLEALDLGRRFATVVLGSHLVNVPDDGLRLAWLRAAARHAAPRARVLVEHHPVDWAETAEPTEPTPGADLGMEEVRRHPPFVSAVSTFDIGGRTVRQPFTARVLSAEELAEAVASAGLVAGRRLGPTWLEASRRF
jgi:hypothetical protein